jgi:hypothetical protein
MSGRHQPENGADSAQALADYALHPYRVLITEQVGDRCWIVVTAAMGKNDARNQALDVAHTAGYVDVTALKIERIPSNHHD